MNARNLRLIDLARIVIRRFDEDRCMQIAASLTFTSLLSIVPILTIALTVIAAFPVFGQLMAALQTFILQNLVPASADVIASYAQQFTTNAARLTAVGIAVLAVTSIMLLITIDRAFNYIWRVPRRRSIVRRVLVYGSLVTVGPILMGASLTLTSWLVGHAVGLLGGLPGAATVLLGVVPIALTSLALALLYVAMPNRRISVRDALVGGVLAGLAFEGMKRAFVFYVAQFPTYTLVYGAFATVPVFLVWIYLSWLVVISGAVLVAALPEWREAAEQRLPAPGSEFFDALHILKILTRAHERGSPVKRSELLATSSAVGIGNIEAILGTMTRLGWIQRTVSNRWELQGAAKNLSVDDVFRAFAFCADAHRAGRDADPKLDALMHEMGSRMSDAMRIPLTAFLRAAEENNDVLHAREESAGATQPAKVPVRR